MNSSVSKSSIPLAEEMRTPILMSLKSGRAKNASTVEADVANAFNLNSEQRAYKVGNSTTSLFSNRFSEARKSLMRDGLIDSPKQGKLRLTELGKKTLKDAKSKGGSSEENDAKPFDKPIAKPAITADGATSTSEKTESAPPKKEVKPGVPSKPEAPKTQPTQVNSPLESIRSFQKPVQTIGASDTEVASSSKRGGIFKTIAVAICMVLAFAIGSCTGSGIAQKQAEENLAAAAEQWQQKADAETAARNEASNLSFVVISDDVSDLNVTAVVHVTGETDSKAKVDDYYRANPNTPYALDYGAGVYLIELAENEIDNGDKVYKHDAMKVDFSDERDLQVSLSLSIDEEKTIAKEEERLKAEEEAKAKAEAEEQAKREAEEKARAEEEARKAAEAEAAAAAAAAATTKSMTGGGGGGYTVYITDTGSKYHHDGCQYLKDSKHAIDIEDAKARGYTPCKKCFGN